MQFLKETWLWILIIALVVIGVGHFIYWVGTDVMVWMGDDWHKKAALAACVAFMFLIHSLWGIKSLLEGIHDDNKEYHQKLMKELKKVID